MSTERVKHAISDGFAYVCAVASAAALFLALLAGHDASAQTDDELARVAKLYPGINPINTYFRPPPNNDADYEPYRQTGSSELAIKPIFTLADGTKTLCRQQPFEQAFLYPRTAYTVWLVENWIFQLQKSGREEFLTSSPGAYFKRDLPAYLNINKRDSLVRFAKCDSRHEFVFRRLPVGQYILFIYHVNFVYESHTELNAQTIMTPDGPQIDVGPGAVEGADHIDDGYIAYSHGATLISAPNIRSTLDPESFRTIVHFKEDRN